MIYILGAGIAGLCLAEALERREVPWRLYEKAAAAGSEASGKNAGIVRTYETDPVIRDLARLSLDYYRRNEPSFRQCGIILRPWDIDYAEKADDQRVFSHRRFSGSFYPFNGTLEPVLLMNRLATAAYSTGSIAFSSETSMRLESSRIAGIEAASGYQPFAEGDLLVVCGGEGSVKIAAGMGRALELIAYRRTLFEFKNALAPEGPVEWNEESGVYFRRSENGTTLTATAGEQIPTGSSVAEGLEDDKALSTLAAEFPFLTADKLVSQRTCKRLTPLDNRPYAGRDAEIKNLFWFTGLGGRGISIGPALAEQMADLLSGKDVAALAPFSPARIQA